MKTLEQLKAEGYEVRVTHLRNAQQSDDADRALLVQPHIARKLGMPINPRGGITIVEVRRIAGHGGKWSRGFAFTHPKDNFQKKVGVAIALGRAMANHNTE